MKNYNVENGFDSEIANEIANEMLADMKRDDRLNVGEKMTAQELCLILGEYYADPLDNCGYEDLRACDSASTCIEHNGGFYGVNVLFEVLNDEDNFNLRITGIELL